VLFRSQTCVVSVAVVVKSAKVLSSLEH